MEKRYNTFNPANCKNRWCCYLDLLGFKKLVQKDGYDCDALINPVHIYYQCREIVEDWVSKKSCLRLICFSDTFLIYSDDDSAVSFWHIEQAVRWIMNENLSRQIPLRGALSCGAMYLVEDDDICIGTPLIEAYEQAENQNWIGFLLCRSATQRLSKLKLPPSKRLNYRRSLIPWNKKTRGKNALYAYLIGASSASKGKNDHVETLRQMMLQAETKKVKNKYQKTIEFLEQHGVLQII
jgi:hypothetical protein